MRAWAPFLLAGCAQMQVAYFSSDATPPIGHPLCGGWIKPVEAVDQPLELRGVVLSDGQTRVVICALDWCRLQTGAYDLFRKKIAEAAGVPESHVAVQTIHAHNAPIADIEAELLLQREASPPPHLDLKFMEVVTDRAATAVRAATPRRFTHIGYGMAQVEQFASSRRIVLNGKMSSRFSSAGKEPAMRDAPEGRIDPWLRTVTLFYGERPLVRLHYYATHPMSFYGDGRATPDVPGFARAKVEPGVDQIYFTGCAGDVTAGKYNDGSPESRVRLTDRLVAGMKGAIAATRRAPVDKFEWDTSTVRFAVRADPDEQLRREIAAGPVDKRIKAALALAWIKRAAQPVDLSRLRLGPVDLLHLPGEPFVEYQLYAQSLRADRFVAVAGYGECGPGYICTDAALSEGGYEPTMSLVGPPSELLLKSAIAELLR